MENATTSSAATTTKLQLAGDIGRLETELAQLENTLRDKERKLQSAKGNRTAGAVALLLGIIVGLFLNIFIGGFLGVIGLLTLLTAMGKQNSALAEVTATETQIAEKRGKLAEMRAQLVVL